MQKQTIYSYLQRSLVKIISKSYHSKKYRTTLVKPLKECSSPIAGNALPIKKSIKIVPLATQVALQSKTLKFFRKANSSFMPFFHGLGYYEHQPSLRFTCKFYLISFLKPRFDVLISKCYGTLLLKKNKVNQKKEVTKQKLIFFLSLYNDQLLYSFLAQTLDTYFYRQTLRCNKKTVLCFFCLTGFCCVTYRARAMLHVALGGPLGDTMHGNATVYVDHALYSRVLFCPCLSWPFVPLALLGPFCARPRARARARSRPKVTACRLKVTACRPKVTACRPKVVAMHSKGKNNLGRHKANRGAHKGHIRAKATKGRKEQSPSMSTKGLSTAKAWAKKGVVNPTIKALKTKAFLFGNPFEQKLCEASTNFDFYDKQLELLFSPSFYQKNDKSTDYRKTFQNLFYFFSFFSFTSNKKVCFLKSAELAAHKQARFTKYAQQQLYLHKIEKQSIACSSQMLCFSSHNLNPLNTLQFLRHKTTITRGSLKVSFKTKRQEMPWFSFLLLCFFTLFFDVSIKYLKQFKKQSYDPFQAETVKNTWIYEFKNIMDSNFISFKPFSSKLIVSCPDFNSHYFFLMRPLFSLTRLDTFFICESLKLPIYPDKSNLRVDFLRNRIRKQILPAIRILLNPQFDSILCKFYE